MKNILYLIVLVVLFSCSTQEKGVPRGEKAPIFATSLLTGATIRLSDLKGKKNVLLYFWADWCPACKKEFPATQAYYEKIKKTFPDFELFAINVGQPKSASLGFQQKFNVTFPMLLDSTAAIAKQYEVEELPTNYFIDKKGNVARRIIGWIDENQVRVVLNQLK